METRWLAGLAVGLMACAPAAVRAPADREPVKTGIDVLEDRGLADLLGKRVGLITNPTGKNRLGRSTAEILARARGMELAVIFSPEHGITGKKEEEKIADSRVRLAGKNIPVRSLYGGGIQSMRPTPEDLSKIDVLVFDIQDIGARFYTYLATMGMALEETARANVELMVLDRPNPLGGLIVEGPVLEDRGLRTVTPTAYYPVPVRHGLTAGEMALLYNAEVGHPRLKVVKMTGWSRGLWYDQTGLPWTPPSPNMPDLEAATLYPGIGLFEASNIAVGRGTPLPFRWVGAPWMDGKKLAAQMGAVGLSGVEFFAQDYAPSKSVFAGALCRGVRLKITDRDRLRPLAVFAWLNHYLTQNHPSDFKWRWDEAKRMTGTGEFKRLHEQGADPLAVSQMFDRGATEFLEKRSPYLLYAY